MLKKNKLKVFDIHKNDINGGSVRFFICSNQSEYKINKQNIENYLVDEKRYKLEKKSSFIAFFKSVKKLKYKTNKILNSIRSKKKVIHGYGASTKGNILLQYFGISSDQVPYIADRNPEKDGLHTPGTKIKIISEEKSRSLKPDYYLVLPWHFKNEIIKREKKIIKKGTKLIFPLPTFEIY